MENKGAWWTSYGIFFLGLWLIGTALSFETKSSPIVISDLVSGGLLIALSLLKETWVRWAVAFVGVWLQFAPLLFWAPNAMHYINDTLIGAAVIALAVLLTPDPIEEGVTGGEVPPGWSYNPSSWPQRMPILFLAFLCWMFARYMAAYQLGYIDRMIDPVFGDGTLRVITSTVSQSFPVSDAGLGALAYTLEMLMGAHGGTKRWHSIPWFVILFAILVVPVGFASIILISLQPLLVGTWCFWCLLTAACMLFMIALAIDEVVAVLQYLKGVPKVSSVFWQGGHAEGIPMTRPDSAWYGIGFPWNLWVTTAIGVWLLFKGTNSDLDHVLGALTIAFSIISMAEVARSGRLLLAIFGLLTVFLTFSVSHLLTGLALILFSLPRGTIHERYGSWDPYIK